MEGIQGAPESRKRLDELMNERRRELRIKWSEVARRAGMTPQNLLRIRKGDISITWDAADGIDDAMLWTRGSVEAAVLKGRRPIAAPTPTNRDDQLDLRDDTERYIWSMDALSENLRHDYIATWRAKKARRASDQRDTG